MSKHSSVLNKENAPPKATGFLSNEGDPAPKLSSTEAGDGFGAGRSIQT